MNNQPKKLGCINLDDRGRLLAEKFENNEKVQKRYEIWDYRCRNLYQRLKDKGYPEEDIREILFMVDIFYDALVVCADVTAEAIRNQGWESLFMRIESSDMSPHQREFLEMLKAKYMTSSGCQWGIDSPENVTK